MKKFEKFIIASDLDGTFLNSESKTVKSNLDAIQYFTENGGSFAFSTGRTKEAFLKVVPEAGEIANMPSIMCNGAYIYDFKTDEKLYEAFLSEKVVSLLIELNQLYSTLSIRAAYGEIYISPVLTERIENEIKNYINDIEIIPFEHFPKGKLNKVVLIDTHEILCKVKETAKRINNTDFVYGFSWSTGLEIQPVGATKGDRLQKLKDIHGMPDCKVFGIGDFENDYEMLLMADYPVTPSNGIEKIKKIPNIIEVCSNDEGAIYGLVSYIEKNFI